MSKIFSGAALHASLDEFGAILQAFRFHFPSAIGIPPNGDIRYFAGAVQDRVDRPGGITPRHRFCAAGRWEVSFRVIEDLVAACAARERMPLLDEFIT